MVRDVPAPVRPVPARPAAARVPLAARAAFDEPAGAWASRGPVASAPATRGPVAPGPRGRSAVERRPAVRLPVYRGLPRAVRLALWAAFSIAVGYAVGSTAPNALRGLGATLALQPQMLPWYSVRALGFVAYLAYAGSVIYGLMLSTKLLDAIAHRPVSVTLHKDLAIAGTVFSVLHGGLLLADGTFAFTPAGLLVPFRSPYAPLAVGVGQLGFYVLAAITASFYVRRRIGQRAWRLLHYLTFAGFVAVAAHGIASGTDTSTTWAFALYVVPAAAVVFLFGYRVTAAVLAGPTTAQTAVSTARLAPADEPRPPAASLEPAPLRRTFVEPSFD